jgi:ABC-2 type transport system ATP-binding protein
MSTATPPPPLSATGAPLAIDVQEATKIYGGLRAAPGKQVRALSGVQLGVHPGEVFGLLGPNGAGKSTLVKILMTVIHPTTARGSMLGAPIGDKATLRRVGYLPEHHKFPDYLRAEQVLGLFGALSGVDRRTIKARTPALLELVGLSAAGRRTVRQYSKGMRQRLGLAQALINDPDVLLLDEPTDGVDPEGRRDIRLLLGRLREQGKAVLINSHILAELELIVDRAAIIHRGRLEAQGTIDTLTNYGRQFVVEAVLPAGAGAPPGVQALGACSMLDARTLRVTIEGEHAEPVQPVLDALRSAGAVVRRVQGQRPTLEEAFIRTIQGADERARVQRAQGAAA